MWANYEMEPESPVWAPCTSDYSHYVRLRLKTYPGGINHGSYPLGRIIDVREHVAFMEEAGGKIYAWDYLRIHCDQSVTALFYFKKSEDAVLFKLAFV